MTTLGVGIIGAGKMGRAHALTYAGMRGVAVQAVCDLDEERGKEVAALCGAAWTSDFGEVLARQDIGALSICLPDHLHRDACLRAAEARKAILLEKPIATTIADAERIIEATAQANVLLLVGHTLRFDTRYYNAKRVIDAGEIGPLQTIYIRRMARRVVHLALLGRVSLPMFLGVHDFDLLRWYTGSEVIRVTAEARRGRFAAAGQDVDDTVSALLKFANGVVATVDLAWNLPDKIVGYQFKADVLGEKGWLEVSHQDQGVIVSTDGNIYTPDTAYTPNIYGHIGGSLGNELEHFVRCVETGEPPVIAPRDALEAVRIALAVEEAARSGQTVQL